MGGRKTVEAHHPEQIFNKAEGFAALCDAGQRSADNANRSILSGVIVTNAALALELYLKCLRSIERGEYKTGHNLRELFDDLSERTKSEIHDAHSRCEGVHNTFFLLKRRGLPTDLNSVLEMGQDAFERFRYAHENEAKNCVWALTPLIIIVKHLILEKRPDWEPLQLLRIPPLLP